ncbi:MAG: ribbon-helix-helix domain-containing protein [archaeon]
MKTLTVAVDSEYVKTLDTVIKSSKLYSSRSEFIKDAVREKLAELMKLNDDLSDIRAAAKRLAKKAKSRGWDGKTISIPRKEKERIANEFMREKGFK